MTEPRKADSLRPILHTLEDQIDETIAEACQVSPARDETTAELEKLGDTLSLAAQAAKTAAQLRRRIREMSILEHLQRRHGRTPPGGAPSLETGDGGMAG